MSINVSICKKILNKIVHNSEKKRKFVPLMNIQEI